MQEDDGRYTFIVQADKKTGKDAVRNLSKLGILVSRISHVKIPESGFSIEQICLKSRLSVMFWFYNYNGPI